MLHSVKSPVISVDNYAILLKILKDSVNIIHYTQCYIFSVQTNLSEVRKPHLSRDKAKQNTQKSLGQVCDRWLSWARARARPPADNSLLRSGSTLGIPIKITFFIRHEGDLNSSLRGTRKKEVKGRGRKGWNPPPFFPPSLSSTLFDACYAGYLYRRQIECIKLYVCTEIRRSTYVLATIDNQTINFARLWHWRHSQFMDVRGVLLQGKQCNRHQGRSVYLRTYAPAYMCNWNLKKKVFFSFLRAFVSLNRAVTDKTLLKQVCTYTSTRTTLILMGFKQSLLVWRVGVTSLISLLFYPFFVIIMYLTDNLTLENTCRDG